jgi:hypothetical protein
LHIRTGRGETKERLARLALVGTADDGPSVSICSGYGKFSAGWYSGKTKIETFAIIIPNPSWTQPNQDYLEVSRQTDYKEKTFFRINFENQGPKGWFACELT